MFEGLSRALDAAEVAAADARELFKCVSACLHLGALHFSEEGDATVVASRAESSLADVAALLGCGVAPLRQAFCWKQIKAGADWVLKPNPPQLSVELCDGLSKALYGRMFDWLQRQVSNALAASGAAAAGDTRPLAEAAPLFAGILDIFGFEIFESNSLEQLCINHANERLQGLFNQVMVLAAEEEAVREGLPPSTLDFSGRCNRHVTVA